MSRLKVRRTRPRVVRHPNAPDPLACGGSFIGGPGFDQASGRRRHGVRPGKRGSFTVLDLKRSRRERPFCVGEWACGQDSLGAHPRTGFADFGSTVISGARDTYAWSASDSDTAAPDSTRPLGSTCCRACSLMPQRCSAPRCSATEVLPAPAAWNVSPAAYHGRRHGP